MSQQRIHAKVKIAAWYDDRFLQQALLTPWSAAHAAVGVVAASLMSRKLMTFKVAFAWLSILHACYEAKDVYYAYFVPGGAANSFVNSVADQAVSMLAFCAAWRARVDLPIALLFAVMCFAYLFSPLSTPTGIVAPNVRAVWHERG